MSTDNDSAEELRARIEEVAAKTRYPAEAYVFVLGAFQNIAPKGVIRHIDAEELCWRLHDQAIMLFGSHAREELERWSICSCDDFGCIVFALLEAGLLRKTEQDSIEDFHNVFDFNVAFQELTLPQRSPISTQWRLSTMFIITTIAAIAFAGAARVGIIGGLCTVISAWIELVGVFLLLHSLKDRSYGWTLGVCFGAGFVVIGLWMFLAVILHSAP